MNPKYSFPFPNDQTKEDAAIINAFKANGFDVVDIQRESPFGLWTWVLTSEGHLYCHDKTHGGGGVFQLSSRAK